MTWLKLDDGFAEHDKILPLSAPAFRLHVVGLLACARNLTDGYISDARFVSVAATAKASVKYANELIEAGLWVRQPSGYYVKDYTDYNPTRARILEERRLAKERQDRAREARKNAGLNGTVTRDTTRDKRVSHAAPTRPDPTRTTKSVVVSDSSFLPSPATDGTEGRILNLQNILGDVA